MKGRAVWGGGGRGARTEQKGAKRVRRKAKESEGRVAHVRGRGLGDGAGWRWDALAARDGWVSPLPETRGRIAVGASLAVCGTGSSRRGVTPLTDWIPSWWINCSCSCGRQSRWGAGRSLASMAPPAVTNIESIKIDGWDSMRIASTRRTVSSVGFSPTMGKPMVPLLFTRQCGSPWSRRGRPIIRPRHQGRPNAAAREHPNVDKPDDAHPDLVDLDGPFPQGTPGAPAPPDAKPPPSNRPTERAAAAPRRAGPPVSSHTRSIVPAQWVGAPPIPLAVHLLHPDSL